MDRRKLLSRGLTAIGLSLIPFATTLAGPRRVTPPSDKDIADAIRDTVRRMAQDAVGKPEKSQELALLRLYVDNVRQYHDKDNVQIGHGTFTGPTSEYVSVVDVVHWYVYGVWGAAHDPTYWAQRSNGKWYLV